MKYKRKPNRNLSAGEQLDFLINKQNQIKQRLSSKNIASGFRRSLERHFNYVNGLINQHLTVVVR